MYKYNLDLAIKIETCDDKHILKLFTVMEGLSEQFFYASWIQGLENILWESIKFRSNTPIRLDPFVRSYIETLSKLVGGWIVWLDEQLYSLDELPAEEHGAYFVTMEEWKRGESNFAKQRISSS